MADHLVIIDDVVKIYDRRGDAVPVLDHLNLEIDRGDFLALMGPSGSGKTTLLNLIAGIDSPTRGKIVVGGRDIATMGQTELARWRSSTVGFIFQLYNLLPVLTAFENVELPLLLTRLKKSERRKHVETALSIVGLADRAGDADGPGSGIPTSLRVVFGSSLTIGHALKVTLNAF
jgi:putative ABC transport system ATP-binding protein